MEPGRASSDVHNVVSGRVDGSVTMAHTIGRIVHGLPWSRVVLIVLVPAFAVLALTGYAAYCAFSSLPRPTVVTVLPAPEPTGPPATTAATTTSTEAAAAPVVPGVAVQAERLVVTTNHPVPATTTAAITTTAATSGQGTPTTTTSAVPNRCDPNPPWLSCRP